MLDTDTCSYVMRRSHESVLRRLETLAVQEVCISAITKAELLHGVELSAQRSRDEAAVRAFLESVAVADFPDEAAEFYAKIRANLKRRGGLIGANDLFIAAHALSMGLTLVTNNTREFRRVRGLSLENWTL